jgi:hypothetical protein
MVKYHPPNNTIAKARAIAIMALRIRGKDIDVIKPILLANFEASQRFLDFQFGMGNYFWLKVCSKGTTLSG